MNVAVIANILRSIALGFGLVALLRGFIVSQKIEFHLQTIAIALACCVLAIASVSYELSKR